MQEGNEEILDSLFGLAIFMLVVAFAVSVYKTGNRYDDSFAEQTHHKASSRYTLAYWDEEELITPAEVYADIIQEDVSVVIQINGHALNTDYLLKAREHDEDGIRRLREALISARYRKVVTFDAEGNVTTINYKEE